MPRDRARMAEEAHDPLAAGLAEAQFLEGLDGQHSGTESHVCGLESVGRPDTVWWAGGRRDAAALREAGFQQVVWLPEAGRDRFQGLKVEASRIAELRQNVICAGDRALADELARRLGRHRCARVTWPAGCADAAATAQQLGLAAVQQAVNAAQPWPIEGVFAPTAEAMLAHRAAPLAPVLSTGCRALDGALGIPSDGRLIIVTGIPAHGKSSLTLHLAAHTSVAHGRRWALFSPEMAPWQTVAAHLIAWRAGRPFRGVGGVPALSRDEIAEGAAWLAEHFAFLATDSTDLAPTLDWWLATVAACIARHGTTDALIDPWNELEHSRGGLTEAEFVNRSLQRLRAFANRHGVNVWIVAHPLKLRPEKPGAPLPVPGLYDINGGAAWANKADLAIAVHRPDTVTEIHVLKARYRRFGLRGARAELILDLATGRFRSASAEIALDDAP